VLIHLKFLTLQQGRAQLLALKSYTRTKLSTPSGCHIDSVFLDCRAAGGNGLTLVVVCEGNCGFYEGSFLDIPSSNVGPASLSSESIYSPPFSFARPAY
jgi:hypothetical protein